MTPMSLYLNLALSGTAMTEHFLHQKKLDLYVHTVLTGAG
jgi:hypothetical protein